MTAEGSGPDEGSSRRFLLDVMLGKLAVYLRICGHDAAYALDRGVEDDDRILAIAEAEDRTLLTRDADLAARAADAIRLDGKGVAAELRELCEAGVELSPAGEPARCGACNGHLEQVRAAGGSARPDLPDYVPEEGAVWRCRDCGQYFWKGSHWEDVAARLADIDGDPAEDS